MPATTLAAAGHPCYCIQQIDLLLVRSSSVAPITSPTWMTALTAAKIPDAVQEKLIALGYESSEAFQFKDEGVLEAFLQHFLVTEKAVDNASETTWAFHPLVGKFKALWKNIMASRKSAPAPTADVDTAAQLNGNSGLVTALVGCNQSLSVVDPMRRDLEKKYTGTVLTLSSLPSMSLLNTIHAQKVRGT